MDGSLQLNKQIEHGIKQLEVYKPSVCFNIYGVGFKAIGRKGHSLLSGTIRGNFFTTAVSSCIMVSMCSVLERESELSVCPQDNIY